MPTNILEAFVKLFADDSALRSSFQGLAPQAHLAGITVGDRFAAGVTTAAAKAHEAFKKAFIGPLQSASAQKDFIGPLQSEFFDAGPGRGMDPYLAARQYGASAKAVEQQARAHTERLKGINQQAAKTTQGFWQGMFTGAGGGGESGGGGGGEGGGHSGVAAFAHVARILAHDVTPALSRVNPALAEFIQAGAASARTAVFFGAAIGGVAVGGAVLSAIIGKYVDAAKEATEFTFQLSQSLKNLDAGRAAAQFDKAEEGVSRLSLSWDQLTGRVKAGFFEKAVAVVDVAVERVTGHITDNFDRITRAASANIDIANKVTVPKALAGERVFNAGILEREAQLNIQTAHTLEELNAGYDKSVKSIKDRTQAEIDALQIQLAADSAAGKTAAAALAQIEINKKLAAQAAELAAKEEERRRALIQAANERQAHAVALGRSSMQADLEFQRGAASDPNRTLKEQQDAEVKVFQTRRSMAEEYFKLQGNLGRSTWTEQLDVARNFLAELTEGSKPWFDQTAKIFDLYNGIREQAKAIFSQQVSIAIGEKDRAVSEQERLKTLRQVNVEDEKILSGTSTGPMDAKAQQEARDRIAGRAKDEQDRLERENAAKISISDIPSLLDTARDRDRQALSGARVAPGDLSGAVGRIDLFRQIDKEGLGPREAFARLNEDPSKQLARAIGGVAGGAGDVTPVLTGLAEAAVLATRALLDLAGTKPQNGATQPGSGESQRGGPTLSEENRQAILDAISTRLTDEKLSVYGRR